MDQPLLKESRPTPTIVPREEVRRRVKAREKPLMDKFITDLSAALESAALAGRDRVVIYVYLDGKLKVDQHSTCICTYGVSEAELKEMLNKAGYETQTNCLGGMGVLL